MNFKKIIGSLLKTLSFLFVILSLAIIIISIFKKEWVEIFIEWIKSIVGLLGYWNYVISFISSLIEAFPVLGGFLPGTNILLIVGGFFGGLSKINFIFIMIFASLGAIAGNFIGYFLGLKYGDIFFEKYGIYFGIGKTEMRYLDKGLQKWGAWGIILGKFHPTTRTFVPFVAGSLKMDIGKFMIYNSIGSIIRSVLTVVMGVLFATYYKILLQYAGYISLVILCLIGLYIYKFKKEEFKKYLQEKNAEIDELSKNTKK